MRTSPVDLEMITPDDDKSETNKRQANKHIFGWRRRLCHVVHHHLFDSIVSQIHHLNDETIILLSSWNNPIQKRVHKFSHEERISLAENRHDSVLIKDAILFNRNGDDMVKRMNWEEAINAWKKSLDDYRSTTDPKYHRMTARLLNKIGIAHYIKDELYYAYESFQQALNIQETALDPGDEEIAITLKNIWILRIRMKQEAEKSYTRELLQLHIMNNLLVKLLMECE